MTPPLGDDQPSVYPVPSRCPSPVTRPGTGTDPVPVFPSAPIPPVVHTPLPHGAGAPPEPNNRRVDNRAEADPELGIARTWEKGIPGKPIIPSVSPRKNTEPITGELSENYWKPS